MKRGFRRSDQSQEQRWTHSVARAGYTSSPQEREETRGGVKGTPKRPLYNAASWRSGQQRPCRPDQHSLWIMRGSERIRGLIIMRLSFSLSLSLFLFPFDSHSKGCPSTGRDAERERRERRERERWIGRKTKRSRQRMRAIR